MAKKFTSPRCLTMIVALMFLSMWLPASAEPFNSSFLSFELNEDETGYIVRGVYEGVPKPSGDVIIPAEYNGLPVVKIADLGFANWNKFSTLTLPNTIKEIGYKAFEYCSEMTTLTIAEGSSLTTIGELAFSDCRITTLTIPDNVATIGASAFHNCGSLESVVLPSGLTRIEDNTFYGCSSLANITIPDGVTYIGKEAFSSCSAITAITLPEGIEEYGDYAFYGTGLTSVTSLRATAVEANDELFGYIGCSVYTDATLTVPFGSRFSYYTTTPWSKFSNLKEGIGNIVLTAPTFSVDGGTYDDNVTLEITNPNDRGKIYYYTSNERTVREYTTAIQLTSPFNGDVIAIVIDGDDISECTVQYYDVNIPSLGITVGGVQVNEKNKDNVLGDYSVRFDDKSRILYLSSANIECKDGSYGIEIDDSSITIMLSGNNYISGADYGIMAGYYASGTLTIAGTDSETDALFIEPSNDWGEGVYVYLSNLKVENCKLVTNGGYDGIMMKAGEGVIDGGLEINNARVDLTAVNSAISGVFRFTLGEGLTILEPEGAEFVACGDKGNFDNIQVDGVVQNHVLIGKTGTGVEGINAAQPAADGAIYDIQGRRLERITQPGFYIVNGKKLLVK